ncbi:hypothetical protein D3C72_2585340 [compost metagenome]
MDADMQTDMHRAAARIADWERRHRTLSAGAVLRWVCHASQPAPGDVSALPAIYDAAVER